MNLSSQCGVGGWIRRRKTEPKDHWLDHALEKHGLKLVNETKTALNVLVMFIPVPIFWALYKQQGSRWVFQATRMNGDVGWFTIKPDQMIILNSAFSLILVPMYQQIIYPLLAKIGIKTSLQKMAGGMVSAAASFVFAGLVEIEIEKHFISILWLVPQYLAITIAETMLSIQHQNFAYTEASKSMKSVMLSFVYLTTAGGNLLMALITSAGMFDSQANEFFFFSGLMLFGLFGFILLALRYEYVFQEEKVEMK